jgi:hypothetical protein
LFTRELPGESIKLNIEVKGVEKKTEDYLRLAKKSPFAAREGFIRRRLTDSGQQI